MSALPPKAPEWTATMRRTLLVLCGLALLASGSAAEGAAAPSTTSSANWSGYAASGTRFSAVEAEWVQPEALCASRQPGATAASFWVGFGGNASHGGTSKVEQIGTDSDCDRLGRSYYYAWYELWPRDSVELGLSVSPGDTLWASVGVRGSRVLLELWDLSTDRGVTRSLRLAAPDTSSAEWIAEAPSIPGRAGGKRAALTDFGSVRFADASATSLTGRSGPIASPVWQASAIGLSGAVVSARDGEADRVLSYTGDARGIPSKLEVAGTSFSISWHASSPTPVQAPHVRR